MKTLDDIRKKLQEMMGPMAKFHKAPSPQVDAPRFAFKMKAAAKTGELYLYNEIGYFGIMATDVISALGTMKDCTALNVFVNSPGGDVFEATAIYNVIDRFQGKKTCYIDGLAASAASYVPMACDKVITAHNAMWMIHNPWGMAMGEASDFRDAADMLDQVRDLIVNTYAMRTKQDPKDIQKWMDATTWMDAATAKERGFTDEVTKQDEEDTEPDKGDDETAEDKALRQRGKNLAFSILQEYKNTPAALRQAAGNTRVRIADAEAFAIRLKNRASPGSAAAASRSGSGAKQSQVK